MTSIPPTSFEMVCGSIVSVTSWVIIAALSGHRRLWCRQDFYELYFLFCYVSSCFVWWQVLLCFMQNDDADGAVLGNRNNGWLSDRAHVGDLKVRGSSKFLKQRRYNMPKIVRAQTSKGSKVKTWFVYSIWVYRFCQVVSIKSLDDTFSGGGGSEQLVRFALSAEFKKYLSSKEPSIHLFNCLWPFLFFPFFPTFFFWLWTFTNRHEDHSYWCLGRQLLLHSYRRKDKGSRRHWSSWTYQDLECYQSDWCQVIKVSRVWVYLWL